MSEPVKVEPTKEELQGLEPEDVTKELDLAAEGGKGAEAEAAGPAEVAAGQGGGKEGAGAPAEAPAEVPQEAAPEEGLKEGVAAGEHQVAEAAPGAEAGAAEQKAEGAEGKQVERMEAVAAPEAQQEPVPPAAQAAEGEAKGEEPKEAAPAEAEAAAAAGEGEAGAKRKREEGEGAEAEAGEEKAPGAEGQKEQPAQAPPAGEVVPTPAQGKGKGKAAKGGKKAKKEAAPGGAKASDDYLAAIKAIPAGQTRTYTEVATGAGRPTGARSVGKAIRGLDMAATDVPWWRVVGQDGKLQEGSHAERQLELLREEGARPQEGEGVVEWAKRAGAHVVGAYAYAAERVVFTDLDDARVEEFNPERVEKFGSVDEAEGRGFVRLSAMEIDE